MKPQITPEKITSLDEFGNRLYIHPAEVFGFFRSRRTWVQNILIIIFLVTPWTKYNDQQTILLNVIDREFVILGSLFRAHNAPFLFFLLLGGALTLAYVTSVWGRVWCGWTCPQTVFIDGVYRRIETLIEGNYLKRRKMQTENLTGLQFFKKIIKWILFAIVSSVIAHSFLAYFVGAYRLIPILEQGPNAHPTLFILAQGFTLLFLFDFGWFREQFCTIMCPYGRIQGVLLDKNSLAVGFNSERASDCVKCNKCVSACPIGIDIRNGLQMECIACTACIDACDDIMVKVEKPKGLIKYLTLDNKPLQFFKARSIFYLLAILSCVVGLIVGLSNKQNSKAFIVRGIEQPFKIVPDNNESNLVNHFKLHLTNQTFDKIRYKIELIQDNNSTINAQLISPQLNLNNNSEIELTGKEFKELHLFFQTNLKNYIKGKKIKILVYDSEHPDHYKQPFEMEWIGPVINSN